MEIGSTRSITTDRTGQSNGPRRAVSPQPPQAQPMTYQGIKEEIDKIWAAFPQNEALSDTLSRYTDKALPFTMPGNDTPPNEEALQQATSKYKIFSQFLGKCNDIASKGPLAQSCLMNIIHSAKPKNIEALQKKLELFNQSFTSDNATPPSHITSYKTLKNYLDSDISKILEFFKDDNSNISFGVNERTTNNAVSNYLNHSKDTKKIFLKTLNNKETYPQLYAKFKENPKKFLGLNSTALKALCKIEKQRKHHNHGAPDFDEAYNDFTSSKAGYSRPETYNKLRHVKGSEALSKMSRTEIAAYYLSKKGHGKNVKEKSKKLIKKLSKALDVPEVHIHKYLHEIKNRTAEYKKESIDKAIDHNIKLERNKKEITNEERNAWIAENFETYQVFLQENHGVDLQGIDAFIKEKRNAQEIREEERTEWKNEQKETHKAIVDNSKDNEMRMIYHSLEMLETLHDRSAGKVKNMIATCNEGEQSEIDRILSPERIKRLFNHALIYNNISSNKNFNTVHTPTIQDRINNHPRIFTMSCATVGALGISGAGITVAGMFTAGLALPIGIALSYSALNMAGIIGAGLEGSELVDRLSRDGLNKKRHILNKKNIKEAFLNKIVGDIEKDLHPTQSVFSKGDLSHKQEFALRTIEKESDLYKAAVVGNFPPEKIEAFKKLSHKNPEWFKNHFETLKKAPADKIKATQDSIDEASMEQSTKTHQFIMDKPDLWLGMTAHQMRKTQQALEGPLEKVHEFIDRHTEIWAKMSADKMKQTTKLFAAPDHEIQDNAMNAPEVWTANTVDEMSLEVFIAEGNFGPNDNQAIGYAHVEKEVKDIVSYLELKPFPAGDHARRDTLISDFKKNIEDKLKEVSNEIGKVQKEEAASTEKKRSWFMPRFNKRNNSANAGDSRKDNSAHLKQAKEKKEKYEAALKFLDHTHFQSKERHHDMVLKDVLGAMLDTVHKKDINWMCTNQTLEGKKDAIMDSLIEKLDECQRFAYVDNHVSCIHGAVNRFIKAAQGVIKLPERVPNAKEYTNSLSSIVNDLFDRFNMDQRAELLSKLPEKQQDALESDNPNPDDIPTIADLTTAEVGGKTLLKHIEEESVRYWPALKNPIYKDLFEGFMDELKKEAYPSQFNQGLGESKEEEIEREEKIAQDIEPSSGTLQLISTPLKKLLYPSQEAYHANVQDIMHSTLRNLPEESFKEIQTLLHENDALTLSDIYDKIERPMRLETEGKFAALKGDIEGYNRLVESLRMDKINISSELFAPAPSLDDCENKLEDILEKAWGKGKDMQNIKIFRNRSDNILLNALSPFISNALKETFPSLSAKAHEKQRDTLLEAVKTGRLREKAQAQIKLLKNSGS